MPASAGSSTRHRHGEDAPFVDALVYLLEAGRCDQRVHLGLGASSHHPGVAAAVAGQSPGNELELWMPGLAGVDQITAGFDRRIQTGERSLQQTVIGEQLVEARDDGQRRFGIGRREAGFVEGVTRLETRDV